ncbi:MAG: phosphotransferase [Planctomycetota bacterium]|nr:phosphotransferase [Planctomycetota bacterium]
MPRRQIAVIFHRTWAVKYLFGISALVRNEGLGSFLDGSCMKKIDLHIHTVSTISDSPFEFSLDVFKRYVLEAKLDAVAVTNHDVFDAAQFRRISQNISAKVFPGIEVNVENGHVLVIAEPEDLDDFEPKTKLISQNITKVGDRVSFEELAAIFGDLNRYLVIPHYEKSPPIKGDTLKKLLPYISAGEVNSPKKFIRTLRDDDKLTPVLFSDSRMKADIPFLPSRHTYVDCGIVTLAALKASLRDKGKVALSEVDGNKLWQVFENGQHLSTGLNVLVGERSSGKTHTLDRIAASVESAKYIRQFSLLQQDEAACEREFKSGIERRRSAFVDEYLSGLRRILDEVSAIDLLSNDKAVERYVETLLKSAEEADRKDAFSKAALFDEVDYPTSGSDTLKSLIESVRQVIENIEYREVIETHVDLNSLRALACELIEMLWKRSLELAKRAQVNEIVREVKQGLRVRTAATQIDDFDAYNHRMDQKRVQRFSEVVGYLRREEVIFEESLQGFKIEARKGPFRGAGEVRAASGRNSAFMGPFRVYDDPYLYLKELLSIDMLPRAQLCRLFSKVSYRILNEDGFEVSGGERSEFRLLQEIDDAQNYDILLIDEPESSFDNLFLRDSVNQILRDISNTMPVVVVTHNNTVGASAGADYLLHTVKEKEGGAVAYRVYSGYPTDKRLQSTCGRFIGTHNIIMTSLEAGASAYEGRRANYEALKD